MPNLRRLTLRFVVPNWDRQLGYIPGSYGMGSNRLAEIFVRSLEVQARIPVGSTSNNCSTSASWSYEVTARYHRKAMVNLLQDSRLADFFEVFGNGEKIAALPRGYWREVRSVARTWFTNRRAAYRSVESKRDCTGSNEPLKWDEISEEMYRLASAAPDNWECLLGDEPWERFSGDKPWECLSCDEPEL
jgi:hypothetical protein